MNVLIIDDDTQTLSYCLNILQREQYGVLLAHDIDEARTLISEADILVVDVRLPKMDGNEIVREMRDRGNYAPVIVMTGFYEASYVMALFKDLEIIEVLEKPFTPELFLAQIRKAKKVAGDLKTVSEASDQIRDLKKRLLGN